MSNGSQNLPVRRIVGLLCATALVFVVGTAGFHLIEEQPLFDSFYMTLITLTSVGYEEIFELSDAGRYFNAILIITGFGVVFVGIGMLAESLLQLELHNYFNRRRTTRMIDKLSGHYIVCGLGRVGREVVHQLELSDVPVVAIDKDPTRERWTQQQSQVRLIVGDATLDATLKSAGAERAEGLVAATSSDASNVYITLSARVINPGLRIGARASTSGVAQKLTRAGADSVFTPYRTTGYRIAQSLLRPEVSRFFLNVASAVDETGLGLDVEEYHVSGRVGSSGKTITALGFTDALDVIVLGISKPGETLSFNPDAKTRVQPGDVLIVLGRRATLDSIKREIEG